MSAGSPHKRHNLKHPKELKKIMAEGDTSALASRWKGVNVEYDMPDLAGYDVAGEWVYFDRDFFRALLEPDYATKLIGEPIDTGMSPDDTVDCLVTHEHTEKQILDGDNPVDDYEAAHEFATCAEHEEVRKRGGSPLKYERGLAKIIKFCELKTPTEVPEDFACAPLLDDPDDNDRRVLEVLRQLGVEDASKESKRSVDYSPSTGEDRCDGCQHWQNEDRAGPLSPCAKVSGLVRVDRWCQRYQALTDAAHSPGDQGQGESDGEGEAEAQGEASA